MIPKAELHCHTEGAMSPALVRRLGERYGVDTSALFDAAGHYIWHDFTSFLAAYDGAAGLLRKPEDYRDHAYDYFTAMAAEGCLYGEFFASADHAAAMGYGYVDMIEALDAGMADAEAETGIVGRITLTCIRHLGPEQAVVTARLLERHPHPRVTGFGMGGDERIHHPRDFAPAFDIARGAGMRITSHAGELDGPESVRATLDHLRPERIGHGVRAIEDPALVERLAEEEIVLEVCPGSNLALSLYPSAAEHPILRLRDAGVKVTISSDDPPFFHTSIGAEYSTVQSAFALSDEDMTAFTRTSLDAAFVDPETHAHLLARAGEMTAEG